MRFRIRVDPWWWPLLMIGGVFPGSPRYVSLEEHEVHVRLGWLQTRFPRAHVVAARRIQGDWRWSIGWNWLFVGTKALIVNGSWTNMVELRLEPEQRSRLLLFPIRYACVRVSLDQPDALLAALDPRPADT